MFPGRKTKRWAGCALVISLPTGPKTIGATPWTTGISHTGQFRGRAGRGHRSNRRDP
jgi:hypothetical protein